MFLLKIWKDCLMFTCKELKIETDNKKLVDISFSFKNSFALIGESGSGKSLSLKAFLGMLTQDLNVKMDLGDFIAKKGQSVALVPQNPFTALSPLTKIINQFLVPRDEAKEYFKEYSNILDSRNIKNYEYYIKDKNFTYKDRDITGIVKKIDNQHIIIDGKEYKNYRFTVNVGDEVIFDLDFSHNIRNMEKRK